MPRRNHHPDSNFFRGKGHSYLAAEEALGIGLFILVLAILLIFGCWYYKRRGGYKSLRSKSSTMDTVRTVAGDGTVLDYKTPFQEFNNFNSEVPDAPPAYEKIAADQSPPPYTP
ncbi:melanoma antigen recognized by T-cells 1 [Phaethornis superciliosus]